jgi:sugar lactone lactonase YvrE
MRRRALAAALFAAVISLATLKTDAAAVAVVVPLDPSIGQLPESITIDDAGNVYLSMSNTVWKVKPDGHHAPTPFATLPVPADGATFGTGLKFGPDGYLYAASASFNPANDASHVWRISPAGQVTDYARLDATGFPNDLAWDDHHHLFVTDPWLGLVYEIDGPGQASVWLQDPLLDGDPAHAVFGFHAFGVDGIAFDGNKKNLYLGNLDHGEILRVGIGCHGEAEDVEVFAGDARLVGADGIAFDKNENLYVAANSQNQIAVVDRHGQVSLFAHGGPFDGPSSLVWGTQGNSKKTLYIANFAIGSALSGGVPHPALLETTTAHGGLSLP